MTQEEKRIKLAEAARWKGISEQFLVGYAPWRTEPYSDRVNACPVDELECFPLDPLPDYFNDLNAVHELEKVLGPKGQWELYEKEVVKLTGGWGQAMHATAAQRAEVIGLTLSLWE
jgi:hypothetical protein